MLKTFFGLASGVLPLAAAIPYMRDIAHHKTKPHRVSFFIWSVLAAIAFFTQLAGGARWSLFLPAADGLVTLAIFMMALGYGEGGFTARDYAALVLAAVGLGLWYVTKQPVLALLIVILVDAIGAVLTLIKTYHDPTSETFSLWLLASLGGLCAALAVGQISFALLVYPLYIFVANGSVNVVIWLDHLKTRPHRP
jgi:hypothetical protein